MFIFKGTLKRTKIQIKIDILHLRWWSRIHIKRDVST